MEFKFNIKSPTKTNRKSHRNTPLHKIIERNVEGICYVDIDGYFVCICNSKVYNFTKDSYKLYNGNLYCTQLIDNKLLKTVRLKDIPKECYNPTYMMPFMAGVICKGDIIKNTVTNELQFSLKKTWTDWKNEQAKTYFKFYKNNYETIRAKLLQNG